MKGHHRFVGLLPVLNILMVIPAGVTGSLCSNVAPAPNGIEIPEEYRDWPAVA